MTAILENVPLTRIKVGDRFRKDYGDIEELQSAIEEKGVLQPITLDKDYNLQAGGRRYQAAANLNLPTIPALIRESAGELDMREVELMENVFRKDMTWVEKNQLTTRIHELYSELKKDEPGERVSDQGWSARKTAKLMGLAPSSVNRHLQLTQALKSVPALAECKTEEEAMKLIKKASHRVEVSKRRAEQDERMAELPMVKHAESHFNIGDALQGIKETIQMYKDDGMVSNIGLLEVDPPYGIDLHESKKGGNVDEYTEVKREEYQAWLNNLTELLYSLAARDAWCIFWFGPTWFCEVKSALLNAGFAVDDIPGIWAKGVGQTAAPEINLGRAYEPFFIARKGSPRLNAPGTLNVFSYPPVPPSDKWHPTQRPVGLIQKLLETFAMPSTVCCSPFLGSGTTLLASYNARMAAFGWDLSQAHKDRFLLEVEEQYRDKLDDELGREEEDGI